MIALALLLAAPPPQEEVFLSRDEAIRIAIPDAERVVERRVTLTADEAEQIQRAAHTESPVPTSVGLLVGTRGGQVVGYALIQNEIGKFHDITFIVGLTPEARVEDVAVLVYRESVGSEVRREDFVRQFRGRGPDSPVRRHRDLINITGATMSVDAIARGVRKAIRIVDFLRTQPDRIAADDPVVQERYVMGTTCRITAYGTTEDVDAAFDEIRRWDRILSIYDPESELSRFNAAGGGEPTADLRAFLDACADFHSRTRGAFDPTVGPAVRAWGFLDRQYRVPPDNELAALVVGWERVERTGPVRMPSGMEIDPGAIGKGWAIDRAAEVLRARGVTRALLDFRSTALAMGGEWTFEIEATCGQVIVRDRAISTSALTDNAFEQDGRRYGHILDPRTRRPVDGMYSVTVLAPTATAADALSTGFFVLGRDSIDLCTDGVEAFLVPDEGEPVRSAGWPE